MYILRNAFLYPTRRISKWIVGIFW